MIAYDYNYTYSRKGGVASLPWRGTPSFVFSITEEFPSPRKWRLHADATDVIVSFETELSSAEQTTLDTCYSDWVAGTIDYYTSVYEVETIVKGRRTKREWFQTDDGDGTYSDLAKDEVTNWQGSKLVSIITTEYYIDGAVRGNPITETFFTTSDGKHVTKVS
jgi:hypothetical protein